MDLKLDPTAEAMAKAQSMALRALADLLERDQAAPFPITISAPLTSVQTIDPALLAQAREWLGPLSDEDIIREALIALLQRESARQLAEMGGTEPQLRRVPRRRFDPT